MRRLCERHVLAMLGGLHTIVDRESGVVRVRDGEGREYGVIAPREAIAGHGTRISGDFCRRGRHWALFSDALVRAQATRKHRTGPAAESAARGSMGAPPLAPPAHKRPVSIQELPDELRVLCERASEAIATQRNIAFCQTVTLVADDWSLSFTPVERLQKTLVVRGERIASSCAAASVAKPVNADALD
jgi:hypothetical protein